jgi:DNA polymerase (family 10)
MAMKKLLVRDIFNQIADLLELKDENPFRIRAYRKAAQNIENLTADVEELAQQEKLVQIPGIGKDLADKIQEIVRTGQLRYFDDLKKKTPSILLEMIGISGIGPKTAKLLYAKLKIKNIDHLERLAKNHKISGLPGMKDKTEENILKGIAVLKKGRERMGLGTAVDVSMIFINALKGLPHVKRINPAGSLRRMKDTVRDIDLLVVSNKPRKVMEAFIKVPEVGEVLAHGSTKSSIRTKEGIQVDVRVVDEQSYGAALVYFTGSKTHNIHIRRLAKSSGLKINEYGVYKEKTDKKIAGLEEKDVYDTLDLPYIPPELREDTGEVECAQRNKLPKLVGFKDIKGDFHVHSDWSDGVHSLRDLARFGKERGYEYLAICDHTKSLKIAGGLNEKELLEQIGEIRKLNTSLKGFQLLAGTEVDILKDGSLDIKDDVLKELDIVVAALHSGFKQSREQLTTRLVRAMQNECVHIIAHPTGRLIGGRSPYELDFEELFKVAKDTNTALEINAFPSRLDLNDTNARSAKEHGIMLAVGTDTHISDQLGTMILGVGTARRGWIEKNDVLNTRSLSSLLKQLR